MGKHVYAFIFLFSLSLSFSVLYKHKNMSIVLNYEGPNVTQVIKLMILISPGQNNPHQWVSERVWVSLCPSPKYERERWRWRARERERKVEREFTRVCPRVNFDKIKGESVTYLRQFIILFFPIYRNPVKWFFLLPLQCCMDAVMILLLKMGKCKYSPNHWVKLMQN